MADPMTPERLAEIRDRADALTRAIDAEFAKEHDAPYEHGIEYYLGAAVQVTRAVPALLAEVERLRAELADEKRRNHYVRAGNAERENAGLRAELAEANHVATVTGEKLAAVRGQRDRAEAERDEARAELGAYHAAAESTDLEGDVGDHLTPLADWQTENGTAPEWLVDAVIGLIAPVKAERDRLTEQVNGDRLHTVIEAALIAYWCLERGKREPDRLDLANAWSHAAVLVDALRRAGLPTGREALHDAHGVGDAVASALSRLDGAEADQ